MDDLKRQHENFEIDTEKKRIVRQDRFDADPGQCFLQTRHGKIPVHNYSPFGLLLEGGNEKIEKLSKEQKLSGTLVYFGIEVQDLILRSVRVDDFGLAFEIEGAPLKTEILKGIETANSVVEKQESLLKRFEEIRPEFKMAVFEVKDWLSELKLHCDEVEKTIEFESPDFKKDFQAAFAQTVSYHLRAHLPEKHTALVPLMNSLQEEKVPLHIDFFRSQLNEILHLAPFSHRSFNKPRGYAGDFEMMNQLYRNDFEGGSLFAMALHNYFINEPAGKAVRNRLSYLTRKIVVSVAKHKNQEQVSVASIASGPAREITACLTRLEELETQVKFTCVDQDEESLKGAQKYLRRQNVPDNVSVEFDNLAIKNIIARGYGKEKFELVYSAGLFDYFTEPVAIMAAKRLLAAVKPGGELIIGNFSLSNPTVALMNMAWDWHLIYRSEETLKKMFGDLGAKLTIEMEPLGINLFCVLKKQ